MDDLAQGCPSRLLVISELRLKEFPGRKLLELQNVRISPRICLPGLTWESPSGVLSSKSVSPVRLNCPVELRLADWRQKLNECVFEWEYSLNSRYLLLQSSDWRAEKYILSGPKSLK